MEVKKSPKADLNNKKLLFVEFGLVLSLLITIAAFEYRTREKKESIEARCRKAKEIVDSDPGANFILWHDREAEREELKKLMPEVVDIYGTMDYEEREKRVIDFSQGRTRLFATKKSLSGVGCNFQYHCHREIFVGIDYEFRTTVVKEFHQAEDFPGIGELIRGAKHYYLQCFTDRDTVPFGDLHAPSKEDLETYADIMKQYVSSTEIRGVE